MLLEYDKIAQVKEIAREIAKEEIEAMSNKALEAGIKDLEAQVKGLEIKVTALEMDAKDLKAEINRAKEVKRKQ